MKLLLAAFAAVTTERSGRSEFAQLVTHHVFGDVHLHVFAAVMNHERHIHKLGNDRASTCPRFDWLTTSGFLLPLHFEKQLGIDERALLATTTHEF